MPESERMRILFIQKLPGRNLRVRRNYSSRFGRGRCRPAARDPTQESTRLLLPALNEMIDVTTSRAIALEIHLPALIFCLLIGIALLTALLGGYAMSKRQSRSWLHMLLYAAIISVTICVIFDFDNLRFGLIKVDAADKALLQLRNSIQ